MYANHSEAHTLSLKLPYIVRPYDVFQPWKTFKLEHRLSPCLDRANPILWQWSDNLCFCQLQYSGWIYWFLLISWDFHTNHRWHLRSVHPHMFVGFQVGVVDSSPALSEARSSPCSKNETTVPSPEPKMYRNPCMKYFWKIYEVYMMYIWSMYEVY